MPSAKKIAVVSKECIACGACTKSCIKQAISVYKGIRAFVDSGKCIGCGKCARTCPAGVITIIGRDSHEKAVV